MTACRRASDRRCILGAVADPPSFARDVKKLFRRKDRNAMGFAMDLWSYESVSKWSDAIGIRLKAGIMPCDGAWPPEKVDIFERWVDGGKQP